MEPLLIIVLAGCLAWAAVYYLHWVLIRRSLSDPDDLAFFYCHAPEGRPVSLPVLIKVAGKRWPAEECFQQGKGQAGLDQHQVRTWHSFHRHTVLSMCAQALLAIAAARPAPPGSATVRSSIVNIEPTGAMAAHTRLAKRGSSVSRRPSPSMLMASTAKARK